MINMFDVSRVAGDWLGAVVLERVLWPHCLHSLGERTDREHREPREPREPTPR